MIVAVLFGAGIVAACVAARFRPAHRGRWLALVLGAQIPAFALGVLHPLVWAVAALGLTVYSFAALGSGIARRNAQLRRIGAASGPRGWRT